MNIEEILQRAKDEPPKQARFMALMPVIQVLREEKEFNWGEVQQWLLKNTEFNYSKAHWTNQYKNWLKSK